MTDQRSECENAEKPLYREVGFARSTYKKARQFQEGIHDLAQKMSLVFARTYLVNGTKNPDINKEYYTTIDELQKVRTTGLSSEMKYVGAQVYVNFKKYPQEAKRLILEYNPAILTEKQAESIYETALQQDSMLDDNWSNCAKVLLGEDVFAGTDIRFGFSQELYAIAPTLKVFELFMWFDENEDISMGRMIP